MECLYTPGLGSDSVRFSLPDDEARHARALRLREGEPVLLTNGDGLAARACVAATGRTEVLVDIVEFLPGAGELSFRLVLALGILDNRDRMEFALEKAVELGASDIVPLRTRYSQRDRVNTERLRSKAVAAMKQAQRAFLTRVHEPCTVEELLTAFGDTTFVLADVDGGRFTGAPGDVTVVVGPEGGFADEELTALRGHPSCTTVGLAGRRLRAETAAILAVGLVAMP